MVKSHLKTCNYYDGIARGYARLYHEEQIEKIFKVKKYFDLGLDVVLDLGCGDGVLNGFLKGRFVVSLDLSFELLKLNPGKNKVMASAQCIPFKDEVFDLIFSFTCLQDVPSPDLVLSECSRVLRKDGLLIVSFLKVALFADEILKGLYGLFEVVEEIKDEKDYIFILKRK